MRYLERKPDKQKNAKKVEEVIKSYTDGGESMKFDPLGMYTGYPINSEVYNMLTNGYKIYMRQNPEQDADDL